MEIISVHGFLILLFILILIPLENSLEKIKIKRTIKIKTDQSSPVSQSLFQWQRNGYQSHFIRWQAGRRQGSVADHHCFAMFARPPRRTYF